MLEKKDEAPPAEQSDVQGAEEVQLDQVNGVPVEQVKEPETAYETVSRLLGESRSVTYSTVYGTVVLKAYPGNDCDWLMLKWYPPEGSSLLRVAAFDLSDFAVDYKGWTEMHYSVNRQPKLDRISCGRISPKKDQILTLLETATEVERIGWSDSDNVLLS